MHAQGFKDAHMFDPERFSPERREDALHSRNFLTFGCGPHYCVRLRALSPLLFAALKTCHEFVRVKTSLSSCRGLKSTSSSSLARMACHLEDSDCYTMASCRWARSMRPTTSSSSWLCCPPGTLVLT